MIATTLEITPLIFFFIILAGLSVQYILDGIKAFVNS